MRVDELDESNVFELAESDPSEGHEKSIREQLYDIDERCKSARYQLEQLEIYACDLLGCQVGDGSDLGSGLPFRSRRYRWRCRDRVIVGDGKQWLKPL